MNQRQIKRADRVFQALAKTIALRRCLIEETTGQRIGAPRPTGNPNLEWHIGTKGIYFSERGRRK